MESLLDTLVCPKLCLLVWCGVS